MNAGRAGADAAGCPAGGAAKKKGGRRESAALSSWRRFRSSTVCLSRGSRSTSAAGRPLPAVLPRRSCAFRRRVSDDRPRRGSAAVSAWPPALRSTRGPVRVAAVAPFLPLRVAAAPVATACASASGPRPPRHVRSGSPRACRRRRPGRLSRARRAVTRGPSGLSSRHSHRPGRAPLVRFSFPYSVRWPCRAVRCCRHPDDPAAAFGSAPPRPPPVRRLRSVEAAVRSGPVAGRRPRPCGFPPVPAATATFPCRHGSATGSNGSCTAAACRPVFRYPREPSHDLAGADPTFGAPAALLGFDPSRLCPRPRVSRRLRRSDPPAVFPAASPRRAAVLCVVGSSGRLAPTWLEGESGRSAAGRGSWASSPRAMRATT